METATSTPTSSVGEMAEAKRSAQVFWQRYFEFYDTLRESIPYLRMIDRHIELLQPAPGDRILDAGTGTGNVAEKLLAAGAQTVGIDFCQDALVKCRQKLPAGEFLFGDLSARLDLDSESFDKIACCNVIYTLTPADQENAVAELYRTLKPGGIAVITVFGEGFRALRVYFETFRLRYQAEGLWKTLGSALRYSINTARILYYVKRIKRRESTGDYTFYTPQQLTDLLTGAGFRVDRVEPVFADQCLLAFATKTGVGVGGIRVPTDA